MKSRSTWFGSVAVIVLVLAVAGAGVAADPKIPLTQLPPAVRAAIQKKFEGAKLTQATEAKASGKPGYCVKFDYKKSKITVWVTREGQIIHGYRFITADDLPKAVAAAYVAKYNRARLSSLFESFHGEKLSFTFVIREGKKTIEVEFDAKGKVIHKEETTDEEES